MSSAKSPALNPADLHDALQTALIEVSENAYFVFVEPADHAQFADSVGLVHDTWLKARKWRSSTGSASSPTWCAAPG